MIDLNKLSIKDISILDAVHALPNICRYGGKVKYFYSVAQHSVELSLWFKKNNLNYLRPLALLHDACEIYIGDIVYPIKINYPEFLKLEDKLTFLFYEKYKVNKQYHQEFDFYDKNIVVNEIESIGYNNKSKMLNQLTPLPNLIIQPKSIQEVRRLYLSEVVEVFYEE